ncbi:Cdc6-like AAA superfamily ATPase [Methylobacterium sp. OAE515]|uniref:ATP-binding protein n=1 Tax=Methylobacterium sp. OAE515 TaxID=2817895 RepID=UPI001789F4D0
MSIAGITEDEFREIIATNLTPSEEIKTPERLFGRQKNLTAIDRALNSPGRQIFVYGDRGVGKSSLAVTAAHVHTGSENIPIYVPCGRLSGFSDVIQAVGNKTISIVERFEKPATGRGFNFGVAPWASVGVNAGTPGSSAIPAPTTIDEALDVIRYVAEKRKGKLVVVIDEMERIEKVEERDKFAEFIKNIPTLGNEVRFIFCGIASDVEELINAHQSAGRILETIKLERLRHDALWKIITTVSEMVGISIAHEMLVRISQISDGFPHFVHLIGDTMFWNVFDDPDPVTTVERRHFRAGIKGALERSDVVLRSQYQKAVQKTRNTLDYEEALWALADSTSDRRQVTDIHDASYRRIMDSRGDRRFLPRDAFNQRLLSLRKEGHGRVVIGHGSGWFGFRENLMRGYVRLRAEDQGITLGRDI